MTRDLAFIGLGIMGLPMAGHLLAARYRVTVHTRTRLKADSLVTAGAEWAASPADAAGRVDIVFVCVNDTPDVEAVLFGKHGVAASARPGTVLVDHSTISPAATRDFAARLARQGVKLIDAPVSGGDSGAKAGTLSVMCGGDREAFDAVRPLLEHVGKTITYCGGSGQGQATKLVNQVLVLGTLAAVCEAMALVRTGGLDPATTLSAVGGGAAASWQLQHLGPKIAAGDYTPGFRVDLALKDLRLVLELASEMGVALPTIDRLRGLYDTLARTGHAGDGTQALARLIVTAR